MRLRDRKARKNRRWDAEARKYYRQRKDRGIQGYISYMDWNLVEIIHDPIDEDEPEENW